MTRGPQREGAVARLLRQEGYLVASLRHVGGPADLLAVPLRPVGDKALLVEVKGTVDYPWRSTWGPERRAEMIVAGDLFGIEPLLAWWPPYYGPIWLPAEDWPVTDEEALSAAIGSLSAPFGSWASAMPALAPRG